MPHRHSPYRHWLVILLLALLSPVMPGKMNLCLLPGGEMHLEVDCATPCSLADSQAVTAEGSADGFSRLNGGRGGCLDFTVGENAARHQTLNVSHTPALGLLIRANTADLFPAGQLHALAKPPAPSPHLKIQQTTVLRI